MELTEERERVGSVLQSGARWANRVAIAIGAAGLAGWAANVPILQSFGAGLPAQAVTSAIAVVAAAIAIAGMQRGDRRGRRAGHIGVLVVVVLATLAAVAHLSGGRFGMEAAPGGEGSAKLMPLATALALLALAAAVMLLRRQTALASEMVRGLATAIIAIAFVALVGLSFRVLLFYTAAPLFGMSLPTALALMLLAASVVAGRPDPWLVGVLADDRPGAVITRWLLPAAVVTPLAAGWLQMGAERVGLIDAAVGAGLLTLGMIIVIGVLALWIARELDRMDLRRQGAENEARTRRDELQVVLASIGDGVIALDEAARVRFLNPAAERLTGRAAAAAIGRSVEEVVELVDERTGEAMVLPLERALREGAHTLAAGEPAVLMPGGAAHAVDVAAVPILGAESEALGVVVVLRDAAARREAERAMRKSYAELDRRVIERTRLLGAVTASTQDLVCARDREGRILLANPAWLRAVGKEATQVIGRTAIESGIDAEPSREQADAEREVIETGTPHVAEETRGGGGEPGTFRVVKSPLRDEQGRIVGLLSVATDISERKLAERELETLLAAEQRMRAEAERANRAKDEFLAIVSHELRSPLNALRGWSHLLARTRPLDPALAERATAAIKRSVEHQARLIDDLLDTSRIMSGKLTLERRPLNLVEVVHAALEVARPAAGAKHVELRSQFDHPVVTVEGDAGRLQQVLTNLLSNAIKFTPENGRVETSVAVIGQHVRLVVRDSGIGIAADFLPHVFDRFSQADTSTTRRTGGLGIGLALVRNLVELHGGTVRAESAGEGQGAAFTIDLPAPRLAVWTPSGGSPPSERGSSASALAGRRVFVVDDDPDARETITFTLRHDGAAVQAFESGAELLGQLTPAPRGEWPDVLLLDLAMPGEDGFAVLARLRDLERGRALAPPLPTIAVTAFTQTDRERLAVAGFHDLVGKPVDGDRLVRAIVEASSRRDPAVAAAQSAFDSAT